MNKYLKGLIFLFILSLLTIKRDNHLLVKSSSNRLEHTNFTQLRQTNNDNAVQIKPQNHLVENSNFSNSFKELKSFSKFNTTSLYSKALFFSFLTRLNEKILNSTLLYFTNIQIIYPSHSFW